jgi:hypothetical protein
MKLFYNLEDRTEKGLPVRTKTFGAVIDEYVKFREKDHQQGRTQAGMLRQVKRVSKCFPRTPNCTPPRRRFNGT